ncbi:A disintegrin and metalloproteinase with thrombospondin motifs 16 [Bulinus truncatus]|nr:A disintegrin and metalloproteinase with thrombospondin motifs 16 [Bulinus truncatus]
MTSCLVNLPKPVNVRVNKRNINSTPEEVTATVDLDGQTVVLNLRYAPHQNIPVPVHTVNTLENGQTYIHLENVVNTQHIANYQDEQTGAVIQMTEVNTSGHDKSTFEMRGWFIHNGEIHEIKPANKVKRQAESENLQHDIKKLAMKRSFGNDYIRNDATAAVPESTNKPAQFYKPGRHARQTSTSQMQVVIDVVAVVDYSGFRRSMRESSHDRVQAFSRIQQQYTLIMHGVDLIYRAINSTALSIKVKLVKIIIIENYSSFKLPHIHPGSKKVDGPELLNRLSQFVVSNNLTDFSDHVMLFIGSDLWSQLGFWEQDLVGIARISSLCSTNGSSVSVVEDMFEHWVITTAAHELAHSVSAEHDGVSNSCSDYENNVMASSYFGASSSNTLNQWTFSQCSIDYFIKYIAQTLDTEQGKICLTGSFPVSSDVPNITDTFFGQILPPKEQCKNTYGKGSYQCKVGYNTSNICTAMYCYDPARLVCAPQIALSGTQCADNKICRLGQCVENDHDV